MNYLQNNNAVKPRVTTSLQVEKQSVFLDAKGIFIFNFQLSIFN